MSFVWHLEKNPSCTYCVALSCVPGMASSLSVRLPSICAIQSAEPETVSPLSRSVSGMIHITSAASTSSAKSARRMRSSVRAGERLRFVCVMVILLVGHRDGHSSSGAVNQPPDSGAFGAGAGGGTEPRSRRRVSTASRLAAAMKTPVSDSASGETAPVPQGSRSM